VSERFGCDLAVVDHEIGIALNNESIDALIEGIEVDDFAVFDGDDYLAGFSP
jgi:hypothetical protein